MAVSREEAGSLTRYIQSLLNTQLKSICSLNGIRSTGVKAELQGRLKELITQCFEAKDWNRYRQLEQSVVTICGNLPNPWPPRQRSFDSRNSGYSSNSSRAYPPQQHTPATNGNMPPHRSSAPVPSMGIAFKKSPFYETKALIGVVHPLQIMPNHKNSVTISVSSRYLVQCDADSSLRIMLFAAKGTHGPQDIAFPQQSDVRIDHVEVKGLNMRGLKNKPGTTRPADLTAALLSRGTYDNAIEFVYALTNEVHYLAAYLCKTTSVEQLVTRIAAGSKISKDSVLREFNSRPQDADELMATSQILSLKCPLSWIRLSLPCRSMSCSHNQCFDATSYLQLQQQGPQWLCPVCNKSAPFDQLAVDEYVRDIVLRTSPSVEQVAIDPNGRWSIPGPAPSVDRKRKAPPAIKQDDDDDISEIIMYGSNTIGRSLSTPRPSFPITPRTQVSRETPLSTSTPTPRSSTSNKRPASQPAVIDLTLSSDEDDEPIARPNKRPYLGR